MRRVALTGLFLSLIILSGCIVYTSPPEQALTMDKGDTLEFRAIVYPASSSAVWTLRFFGDEVDTATGLHYSFTPDQAGLYLMKLDVSSPGESTKSRTWVITVQ